MKKTKKNKIKEEAAPATVMVLILHCIGIVALTEISLAAKNKVIIRKIARRKTEGNQVSQLKQPTCNIYQLCAGTERKQEMAKRKNCTFSFTNICSY